PGRIALAFVGSDQCSILNAQFLIRESGAKWKQVRGEAEKGTLFPRIFKDESHSHSHWGRCRLTVQYCRAVFPFLYSSERLVNKQWMPLHYANVLDTSAYVHGPFQYHDAFDPGISCEGWIHGHRLLDQFRLLKTAANDWW